MTDWRTRPRTGKSQFYPLMPEIQNRLALGETYKQIHDDLISKKRLEIGYDQFVRYIRNHIKPAKVEKTRQTIPVPSIQTMTLETSQGVPITPSIEKVVQPERKPVTRADLRKLRNEEEDWEALSQG